MNLTLEDLPEWGEDELKSRLKLFTSNEPDYLLKLPKKIDDLTIAIGLCIQYNKDLEHEIMILKGKLEQSNQEIAKLRIEKVDYTYYFFENNNFLIWLLNLFRQTL